MKKEQIEVVRGSDNPFRDAGLPNPELENARATLAAEIIGILNERNLSKRKAASIAGIPHADLPSAPQGMKREGLRTIVVTKTSFCHPRR